jgi:hypothetical protein
MYITAACMLMHEMHGTGSAGGATQSDHRARTCGSLDMGRSVTAFATDGTLQKVKVRATE